MIQPAEPILTRVESGSHLLLLLLLLLSNLSKLGKGDTKGTKPVQGTSLIS